MLSLAVGIVLADSAIVTLALPEILRELETSVSAVAWVLTGYNLALGLTAVPAARVCMKPDRAPGAAAIGLVLFAAASAACALAPSLTVLLSARVLQAIGGALVITAALELLVMTTSDAHRGVRRWAQAGVTGAALGPVAGGLLTDAIAWQSIFIVQVPLVLLALPAALRLRAAARAPGADAMVMAEQPVVRLDPSGSDRPRIAANLALALISAALTAALFLLVLLLIEAWRRSPAMAALTVTVIPVAAICSGFVARSARAGTKGEAVAGSILTGGGLIALGFLPSADPVWTLAPQVLVGLGLGLTVESLTAFALRDRFPRVLQGGWTIASRHLGIVAGLLVLTPIFASDLAAARAPAADAVAALVIDASLAPGDKLDLAGALARQFDAEAGRVPEVGPAFAAIDFAARDLPEAGRLELALTDQLERAATRAFRDALIAGGLLALMAILPALALREIDRTRRAPAPGSAGPRGEVVV